MKEFTQMDKVCWGQEGCDQLNKLGIGTPPGQILVENGVNTQLDKVCQNKDKSRVEGDVKCLNKRFMGTRHG